MQYRVVDILNDEKIIINAGKRNNICIGNHFEILSNHYKEIKDPMTGEKLGLLSIPKAEIVVSAVWDKMCMCISLQQSKSILSQIMRPHLNVDPKDVSAPSLSDYELTIRIGDMANTVFLD